MFTFRRCLWFVFWIAVVGPIENAFFGWVDMQYGLTNDVVETAVRWAVMFGVPALTVAVGAYFFFRIQEYFAGPRPPVAPSPAPQGQAAPSRWTWPALTTSEIDAIYSDLKGKHGSHSVHIACDNANCEALADSFAEVFTRLAWPHHIGSGLFDAEGARGLSLHPNNDTARAIKSAAEKHTALRIDVLNTHDSGSTAAVMLVIGTREASAELDFKRGFDRATFERSTTREAALLRLTQLRGDGVVLRNNASELIGAAAFDAWIAETNSWMNEVAKTMKPVNEHDSEWFVTLDTVPAARVAIPNIRLGVECQTFFEQKFREHDYRLVRLDGILRKNGVGI